MRRWGPFFIPSDAINRSQNQGGGVRSIGYLELLEKTRFAKKTSKPVSDLHSVSITCNIKATQFFYLRAICLYADGWLSVFLFSFVSTPVFLPHSLSYILHTTVSISKLTVAWVSRAVFAF
jgi:hypothetical protein